MFALNTLMKQDTRCLNPAKSEPRVYAQLPALPLQVQEEQLACLQDFILDTAGLRTCKKVLQGVMNTLPASSRDRSNKLKFQ